ncbi:MAG TPA: transposase [Terracidiphilus sp.]|jgi:transposase
MPQTHPPYPPEYRRRIVELARAGRSVNELARELEPSASAIGYWRKQAGLDEGLRSDGLTTDERAELNRLRRENRVLREEREILAKAAAWFATETGTVPRHGVPIRERESDTVLLIKLFHWGDP